MAGGLANVSSCSLSLMCALARQPAPVWRAKAHYIEMAFTFPCSVQAGPSGTGLFNSLAYLCCCCRHQSAVPWFLTAHHGSHAQPGTAASAWRCQSLEAARLSTVASALSSSACCNGRHIHFKQLHLVLHGVSAAAKAECLSCGGSSSSHVSRWLCVCGLHRLAACCNSVSSCPLHHGSSLLHMLLGSGSSVSRCISSRLLRGEDGSPMRQYRCAPRLLPLRLACCGPVGLHPSICGSPCLT